MAKEKFDISKPHINIGTIGDVDYGRTLVNDFTIYKIYSSFPPIKGSEAYADSIVARISEGKT